MSEIPLPEVLDPDRVDANRTPEELPEHHERVVRALRETCEYGQRLWRELDRTRYYLLQQVARGEQDGPVVAGGTMLRSERDWQIWAALYGSMFSVLCGPNGDEDLGKHEALHEAQQHDHLLT